MNQQFLKLFLMAFFYKKRNYLKNSAINDKKRRTNNLLNLIHYKWERLCYRNKILTQNYKILQSKVVFFRMSVLEI